MKYEWLFFDADGTLFDFEKAQKNALKNTITSFKITFKNVWYQIYHDINIAIWQKFETGDIPQHKIPVLRFELFFNSINVQADAVQASATYLEFLSREHDLLDDAENLIKTVSKKFNLLLITNGLTSVQRPRFSNSSITPFFKEIIISQEVGCAKPGKEIFDLAFERIGNPDKNKVIIIGDNLGSDILGGNNYGIHTCWYNPTKHEQNNGIVPTFEIDNFKRLLKILR